MEHSSCLGKESVTANKDTGSHNMHVVNSKLKQFYIAVCVNLTHIVVGIVVCWTAPMVPKLQNRESNPLPHLVSDTEASWIAVSMSLGVIIGAQLSAYFSNLIGRRPTLILLSFLHLVGNIMLLAADAVAMVYLGRIVSGMGVGGASVVDMVYVGEITSPQIRGIILTSTGVSHACGGLLIYSVAPFVSYSVVGYITVLLSALCVIGAFCILESPVYYVIRGKNDDARTTLQKLGRNEDIENELNTMIQNAKEQRMGYGLLRQKRNLLAMFSLKNNRKAIFITTFGFLFQQTSGIMYIMFFATSIFQKAASAVQPDIATIVLGVINVLGAILTPVFVERFGRRSLMMISSAICALCTALLGIHFYLELINHPLLESIRWVPLVLLMSFLFFYNAGLGIIPNVLTGEMFSPQVRSVGSSIAIGIGWASGLFSGLSFGYIVSGNGSHVIFAVFTVINILGLVFTAIFVPETKGKSLTEIEEMMNK